MKKVFFSCCIFAILFIIVLGYGAQYAENTQESLGTDDNGAQSETNKPTHTSQTDATVELFQYGDFSVEVSNVKEIKEVDAFDDMDSWTYPVYEVYAGAIVTIIDADTFIDEETGLPHADWAFLKSDGGRIDILDDLESIEITEDILGIYDPESSNFVLEFELKE